jgi:membrane-bound lytic murein transglycosylase D
MRGEKPKTSCRQIFCLTAVALPCLLLLASFSLSAHAASEVKTRFPRPAEIEPNVNFWINVFSYWSDRDFIIHDRNQVWRVYQVMHLPGEGPPSREEVEWMNTYLKTKYGDILSRMASEKQPIGWDEQQVAKLFKGESPAAYAAAAQNLRVQQGLREPFRNSLLRSRYYRPAMEQVFASSGLPTDLVALALIESGFSARAHSSAGAVGIWQFTRSTGREFMRITRYRDDRLDPTRSTEAAARLLQYNYDALGSWPLAITAYDYGTGGMEQAASEYGSDFVRILKNYNGDHFGFATKNYYAEFLAAAQIQEYQEKYFPGIQSDEAPPPPPSSPILRRIIHHFRHRYHHHAHLKRANYHPHSSTAHRRTRT